MRPGLTPYKAKKTKSNILQKKLLMHEITKKKCNKKDPKQNKQQ